MFKHQAQHRATDPHTLDGLDMFGHVWTSVGNLLRRKNKRTHCNKQQCNKHSKHIKVIVHRTLTCDATRIYTNMCKTKHLGIQYYLYIVIYCGRCWLLVDVGWRWLQGWNTLECSRIRRVACPLSVEPHRGGIWVHTLHKRGPFVHVMEATCFCWIAFLL